MTGRFLHLTDFHPDPFYIAGSTFKSGCHKLPKDKHKKGNQYEGHDDQDDDDDRDEFKDELLAGKWGSSVSDCDAPMSLVNLTFDWLKAEWADKVDFVVCESFRLAHCSLISWALKGTDDFSTLLFSGTGDNARHDIDSKNPRTPQEIFRLNRMMAANMKQTFGKDVVVVPSLGNNDIYREIESATFEAITTTHNSMSGSA